MAKGEKLVLMVPGERKGLKRASYVPATPATEVSRDSYKGFRFGGKRVRPSEAAALVKEAEANGVSLKRARVARLTADRAHWKNASQTGFTDALHAARTANEKAAKAAERAAKEAKGPSMRAYTSEMYMAGMREVTREERSTRSHGLLKEARAAVFGTLPELIFSDPLGKALLFATGELMRIDSPIVRAVVNTGLRASVRSEIINRYPQNQKGLAQDAAALMDRLLPEAGFVGGAEGQKGVNTANATAILLDVVRSKQPLELILDAAVALADLDVEKANMSPRLKKALGFINAATLGPLNEKTANYFSRGLMKMMTDAMTNEKSPLYGHREVIANTILGTDTIEGMVETRVMARAPKFLREFLKVEETDPNAEAKLVKGVTDETYAANERAFHAKWDGKTGAFRMRVGSHRAEHAERNAAYRVEARNLAWQKVLTEMVEAARDVKEDATAQRRAATRRQASAFSPDSASSAYVMPDIQED